MPGGGGALSLLSFLNETQQFLNLTEVQWPWSTTPLRFLALQRLSAVLVIVDESEMAAPDAKLVPHQVSCLLEGGVAMGTLQLPSGERVSDRLTHPEPFFPLYDCTLGLDGTAGAKHAESTPHVLVNARQLIGVAES